MYYIFLVPSVLRFLQDEEINQQSQLVEKLNEQMLDQDEVTTPPTFLPFPSFPSTPHCTSALHPVLLAQTQSDN